MRQKILLNLGSLTILAASVKSVGLELSFATCRQCNGLWIMKNINTFAKADKEISPDKMHDSVPYHITDIA